VEYSQALACYLSEKVGVPVWAEAFESCNWESNSFDAFFSFHVIEHVPDPIAHLRKAYSVIRAGGLAFVATPNARSWQQLMFETLSPNFDSAHLRVFSPESLRRASESAGWALIAAYTPEYTTGWLRVATKWLRRLQGKDEEATAGIYAANGSLASTMAFWTVRGLMYPFCALQSGLGGGNELFFVLQKSK
jgi:2-polyprenyl-3-methyl-5-hydroxy-6-metoxy-1,4-benzoquinol methylase